MRAQELKLARRRAGLTQAETARRLGVSQAYVALLEKGKRNLTPKLASRVVRILQFSPVVLPPSSNWERKVDNETLAKNLAALGYPGFAHLRWGRKRNPAEVLLMAMAQDDLESRLTEALPWLLLNYADMNREWLVEQARRLNLSNRLGFVVTLAKAVLEKREKTNDFRYPALLQLEAELRQGRLDKEDTLCQSSLLPGERDYLRQNRPPEADFWHLLTDWRPEHLQYA